MAYIKANHQKMLTAAEEIDTYVVNLKKHMQTIDGEMQSLGSAWKGADYQQLKVQWDEINSSGSTTDKLKISLKNYADSIREASKLYKEAQTRAINRASALCK